MGNQGNVVSVHRGCGWILTKRSDVRPATLGADW